MTTGFFTASARGGMGRAMVGTLPRCLTASYRATPAATDTLSEDTWPKTGSDTM